MHTQHSSFRIATPFTALWRWLMAKPGQQNKVSTNSASVPTDLATRQQPSQLTPGHTSCASLRTTARQPLRVLRVMDADLAPAQIGRLRISGRMADVCAELDRLAALEARFH